MNLLYIIASKNLYVLLLFYEAAIYLLENVTVRSHIISSPAHVQLYGNYWHEYNYSLRDIHVHADFLINSQIQLKP